MVIENEPVYPTILTEMVGEQRYNTYLNQPIHGLSEGEADDFDSFQERLRHRLQGFVREGNGWRGHYGEQSDEVLVESVVDPTSPQIEGKVPRITLTFAPLEFAYTLTGKGLIEETFLPGEVEPTTETFRGRVSAKILTDLERNLHP